MIIQIKGNIPSKKNSKIIVCRGSRPMLLPSANHKAWHEEQMWSLKRYKPRTAIKSCEIAVDFVFDSNRRKDLSNAWESIGDLLVDAGIIEDDSWKVVQNLLLFSRGVDKKNAGATITITEL